jgi:hypothetical protein
VPLGGRTLTLTLTLTISAPQALLLPSCCFSTGTVTSGYVPLTLTMGALVQALLLPPGQDVPVGGRTRV